MSSTENREKKFTPGPWVIDNPNFELVARLNEGVYNYVADCDTSIISLNTETIKANANLIAAAPELLEALEGMVGLFPESPHDDGSGKRGFGKDLINKYDSAIAAIKKAYGETP